MLRDKLIVVLAGGLLLFSYGPAAAAQVNNPSSGSLAVTRAKTQTSIPPAKPVMFKHPHKISYVYVDKLAKKKRVVSNKKPAKKKAVAIKQDKAYIVSAETFPISLKQITLIKVPSPIKKVISSNISGLQVQHTAGSRNLFVSVLPVKRTAVDGMVSYIYSKSPKNVYIETTDGRIYSLNLVPSNVPAQTIYLSGANAPLSAKIANISKGKRLKPRAVIVKKTTVVVNSQSSFVKNNLRLIKDAFVQKIPAGFNLINIKPKKFRFKQADISLVSVMRSDEYKIYTFVLTAKQNIRVSDGQFLFLVAKPLAVAVVNPVLKKFETTRLFIIGGNYVQN